MWQKRSVFSAISISDYCAQWLRLALSCTVRAQPPKHMSDESRKSFAVKRIGGRDRVRTGDPLLAKRAEENTKVLRWCRLHGKSTRFPLLNCPEVVPKCCHRRVAFTESQRSSCSRNVPRLYRISELQTLSELYVDYFRFALIHPERLAESSCSHCRLRRTKRCNQPLELD